LRILLKAAAWRRSYLCRFAPRATVDTCTPLPFNFGRYVELRALRDQADGS